MINNEELREALFDLEQARLKEEKNRLDADCLLASLYILTQPKNELSLFNELLNTLKKAIPFTMACVIVSKQKQFIVEACTDSILSTLTFPKNEFLQRVLTGQPVAFFDINQVTDYQNSVVTHKTRLISALHLPLDTGKNSTVLICFHEKRAFYNKNHLDLAKRFAPLASHALQTQRAKAKADMASKAKSDFLAVVSHEIRTPLNGVIGMNELMLETQLSDEQSNYAMTIKHSAESLLTIINDILDFSKIEAGQLQLELIEVNLFDEVTQVIQTILPMINHSNVEFHALISPTLPQKIYCDPIRLKQVLLNLLSNACKFTAKGDITFQCDCAQSFTDNHYKIMFSIHDTGIGIPISKKETIFESFKQADISTTRRFGGTGLGLSITKKLIDLMQGKIDIKSKENKGTCVNISIDCQATKSHQSNDLSSIHLQSFVIEFKSHSFSKWLKTKLIEHNGNVLSIDDLTADHPDPILIIDLGLDKATINSKINAYSYEYVIGYFTKTQDRIKCRHLAINQFVQPPILINDINTAISVKKQHKKITMPLLLDDETDFKHLAILVVEDNLVNQMLLKTMLSKKGVSVTVADNGNEALNRVANIPFDLIFMDMQMPIMDGIEATQHIRKGQTRINQFVPIIALTANVQASDRQRCSDAGMDDFLSKPVHWKDIEDTIKRYCRVKAL